VASSFGGSISFSSISFKFSESPKDSLILIGEVKFGIVKSSYSDILTSSVAYDFTSNPYT